VGDYDSMDVLLPNYWQDVEGSAKNRQPINVSDSRRIKKPYGPMSEFRTGAQRPRDSYSFGSCTHDEDTNYIDPSPTENSHD
jgi:hypothetical protein